MREITIADIAAKYGIVNSIPCTLDCYTFGHTLDVLCTLAKHATRIVEFGTACGRTTLAMAKENKSASIVTIDMPNPQMEPGAADTRPWTEIGQAFHGQPEESRITQVWVDPREPYNLDAIGACDFAFIDGSHTLAGVTKDTVAVCEMMLGSGRGIIVWDDYLTDGVPVLIDRIAGQMFRHVADTRLTFVDADDAELRRLIKIFSST